MQYLGRPEDDVDSPETGHRDDYEPSCGWWDLITRSSGEKDSDLYPELFFQPFHQYENLGGPRCGIFTEWVFQVDDIFTVVFGLESRGLCIHNQQKSKINQTWNMHVRNNLNNEYAVFCKEVGTLDSQTHRMPCLKPDFSTSVLMGFISPLIVYLSKCRIK